MGFSFIDNKIKVFISSKCGEEHEDYEIIRRGLKTLLEETGFIKTYVFEDEGSSSIYIRDEYLSNIEDSHVVLFLIDNDKDNCSEGVMKEWLESKKLDKKAIVLFCNNKEKEITIMQKELKNPNSIRWSEVNNKKDFIDKAYKAIIEDIIKVYNQYSKNKMIIKSYDEGIDEISDDKTLLHIYQNTKFEKSVVGKYQSVIEYFESLYADNKLEEIEDLGIVKFAKVLLGNEKYNDDILKIITDEIGELHNDVTKTLVLKRWKAINYIYCDDIQNAIEVLDDAYNFSLKNNVDNWLLNDILIDKRNLEILNNSINNIMYIETNAQKTINDRNEIIYYPILDRIYKEIEEKILDEIKSKSLETPYTNRIGTSLKFILGKIGEYYIWSVYYGSYTHAKMVISLLKKVFFNFYKLYDYNKWGLKTLKYAILDDDFDIVKDICERNSEIISTCSSNEIFKLYVMTNYIAIEYKRNLLKLNVFKYLGYYFNDDNYEEVKQDILEIMNNWINNRKGLFMIERIFESLEENIYRFENQKIVDFLLEIIKRKLYSYNDKILELFRKIDFNTINEISFNQIVDFTVHIINKIGTENMLFNDNILKLTIIHLRKYKSEYSKVFDQLIKDKMQKFYNSYKVEVFGENDENYKEILSCIEDIRKRNLKQGKNGLYSYSLENPEIIIKNIIQLKNVDLDFDDLLYKITNVCKDTLINEKQLVKDKINTLKLLIYLIYITKNNNMFDWKSYYNDIVIEEKSILDAYEDDLMDKKTKHLLYSVWVFYKIINNDVDKKELLNMLSSYNDYNVYDNMIVLEVINDFIRYDEKNDEVIYLMITHFVLRYMYDKNDEVTCRVINCIFSLIKKSYVNTNSNDIIKLSENGDFKVKSYILYNIENQSKEYVSYFKNILEKYKVDNNYLIRKRAIDLLDNISN